jgi:hypothetical protein
MISPVAGVLLQDAATSGNGVAHDCRGMGREHTFYVRPSAGTISTGKVKIETCHDKDFTGTWAILGSEITLASGVVQIVQVTGCLRAIRARISTTVTGTGGNVSVSYEAN